MPATCLSLGEGMLVIFPNSFRSSAGKKEAILVLSKSRAYPVSRRKTELQMVVGIHLGCRAGKREAQQEVIPTFRSTSGQIAGEVAQWKPSVSDLVSQPDNGAPVPPSDSPPASLPAWRPARHRKEGRKEGGICSCWKMHIARCRHPPLWGT